MPKPSTFGSRVESYRLARGWTRSKLAQSAGCDVRTVFKVEREGMRVSLDLSRRFAKALRVRLEVLARAASKPRRKTVSR